MARIFALLFLLCFAAGISAAESGYFPEDTWVDRRSGVPDAKTWTFYERWYGGQLSAMEEKPLWRGEVSPDAEVAVRLLFLPTFHPASSLLLIAPEAGKLSYTFKQLDGAGGYDPGQLILEDRGLVPSGSALEIAALIEQIDAFSFNTSTNVINPSRICFDGTQVVFEFRRGTQYKAISRHECELPDQDPIRLLVLELNEVSLDRMIPAHTFETIR